MEFRVSHPNLLLLEHLVNIDLGSKWLTQKNLDNIEVSLNEKFKKIFSGYPSQAQLSTEIDRITREMEFTSSDFPRWFRLGSYEILTSLDFDVDWSQSNIASLEKERAKFLDWRPLLKAEFKYSEATARWFDADPYTIWSYREAVLSAIADAAKDNAEQFFSDKPTKVIHSAAQSASRAWIETWLTQE